MLKSQFIILLVSLMIWSGSSLIAQCDSEANDAKCVEKITETNTFVKSYKLDSSQEEDVEFSSVLVKDTRYYLNLCEAGQLSDKVVINVYDTKRKLVATNKTNNSVNTELSFSCDQTGIYYFEFKRGATAANCGIGALSFRRLSSR